jgi:hypothetical protein
MNLQRIHRNSSFFLWTLTVLLRIRSLVGERRDTNST